MYKCQKCGYNVKHNIPCKKIIIETRDKEYNIPYIGKDGKDYIKTTVGTEIVKELKVCSRCEKEFNNENN